MNNCIEINFSDLEAMKKVMDEYHTTNTMLFGENSDGEFTTTSIFRDKIVVVTYQENDYVCESTLHRDGTIEHIYKSE